MTDSCTYEIQPVVRTPYVDKGDTIRIDVFFTGSGIPNRNKLFVSHNPDLTADNPGEMKAWILGYTNEEGITTMVAGETDQSDYPDVNENNLPPQIYEIDTITTIASFVPSNFTSGLSRGSDHHTLRQTASEVAHQGHPPLEIKLNTDEYCRSGDYDIPVVFTYTDNSGMHQTKSVPQVHVKSFRETHQKKIVIATIVFAFLSAVVGAIGLFA